MKTAVSNQKYDYYHLLTGVDFPLVRQDAILNFFDMSNGEEFISTGNLPVGESFINRIKFYYPFQDVFKSRKNIISKVLRKVGIRFQKLMRVDRTKEYSEYIRCGSAYFDITNSFAEYIIKNEGWIECNFKYTFCADELFVQTLLLQNNEAIKRVHRENGGDSICIQKLYLDVKRAIDWNRGNPYTYTEEDYEMLMSSGCLFARKFDYYRSPEIVEKIYGEIMKEGN